MRKLLIALGAAAIVGTAGVTYADSATPAASTSAAPAASTPAAATKSVWDGVYTDAQADQGADLIAANCARCHSNTMRGGPGGPSVMANLYTMFGDQPLQSFYDYISTQMPKGSPGSLAPDEYASISARVLQLAGAPSGSTALPSDEDALAKITLSEKK
jgi:S-disulfanyl-L-cysteine oxidoreductase SoxD